MPRRGIRRGSEVNTLDSNNNSQMPDVDTLSFPPADGGWPGGFQTYTPLPPADTGWPGDFQAFSQPYAAPAESTHVRASAALGAMLSVVGLCAAASGLLAPEGFALAIVGTSLSTLGVRPAGDYPVAGRGLAAFGLLCGLGALALSVLAMTRTYAYPNSSVNELSHLHGWLVAHWSWLGRWSS